MRVSDRNAIWPSVEHRLAQGETGFTDERQEIDFSDAPIAKFTAKFARWAGFRGMNRDCGNRHKYTVRCELGLKLNRNQPRVEDLF